MLQNSKNGLQRFFREKSNQTTIADRCVLKRANEVAGEFNASCCGPPHDYSICRAHGPKNLSSVIQKEFCNRIPQLADIRSGRRQVSKVPILLQKSKSERLKKSRES